MAIFANHQIHHIVLNDKSRRRTHICKRLGSDVVQEIMVAFGAGLANPSSPCKPTMLGGCSTTPPVRDDSARVGQVRYG